MDKTNDTRNVIDEFKGVSETEIVKTLDQRAHNLVIAVENIERDFSMGTIVRSSNAFGVRTVHVIGRRQWNKRGAMKTETYLHMVYHADVDAFVQVMREQQREIVVVDNIDNSTPLSKTELSTDAVLVFGQEGPGVSDELAAQADKIVAIEQFGSTRSVNVGVAAGIAMYVWLERYRLN